MVVRTVQHNRRDASLDQKLINRVPVDFSAIITNGCLGDMWEREGSSDTSPTSRDMNDLGWLDAKAHIRGVTSRSWKQHTIALRLR